MDLRAAKWKKITRYLPLFVLVAVSALSSLALVWGRSLGWMEGMQLFMGLLFSLFAMLKLFHLPRFVEGFRMYDWIAKRWRGYAYLYPFIELTLGLAYLSGVEPTVVNILTIVITSIGAFGVCRALKAGLDLRCACMGTILDVPLSTVTLTEDIGMAIMALAMIVFR